MRIASLHFPSAEVVETSISIDQQARDNYQFDIMHVMNVFLTYLLGRPCKIGGDGGGVLLYDDDYGDACYARNTLLAAAHVTIRHIVKRSPESFISSSSSASLSILLNCTRELADPFANL